MLRVSYFNVWNMRMFDLNVFSVIFWQSVGIWKFIYKYEHCVYSYVYKPDIIWA